MCTAKKVLIQGHKFVCVCVWRRTAQDAGEPNAHLCVPVGRGVVLGSRCGNRSCCCGVNWAAVAGAAAVIGQETEKGGASKRDKVAPRQGGMSVYE